MSERAQVDAGERMTERNDGFPGGQSETKRACSPNESLVKARGWTCPRCGIFLGPWYAALDWPLRVLDRVRPGKCHDNAVALAGLVFRVTNAIRRT